MQQGLIGTQLTDEIEFELPMGKAGQLGEAAVRGQLERTFAMRQERLPRLLDGTLRQRT